MFKISISFIFQLVRIIPDEKQTSLTSKIRLAQSCPVSLEYLFSCYIGPVSWVHLNLIFCFYFCKKLYFEEVVCPGYSVEASGIPLWILMKMSRVSAEGMCTPSPVLQTQLKQTAWPWVTTELSRFLYIIKRSLKGVGYLQLCERLDWPSNGNRTCRSL